MKVSTVDLFCGCGGMSLGFQRAGFEIAAAYDNWQPAIDTYKQNFSHPAFLADLSLESEAIQLITQHNPDAIIGGPPCQDFSIAGLGVEQQRANLTLSFARICVTVGPRYIVMENVYNIERSSVLPAALDILRRSGYGITSLVLNASLVGVPQMRKRYFLIADRESPDHHYASALMDNLQSEPTTVFDIFGDSLGTEFYYAHPRNYKRRAVFSIHEPAATIRRVNRPIPPTYKPHPADKAPAKGAVRPLTTDERAKIQSFPPTFNFEGTLSQREQLIGNAVPPQLAEYVASTIAGGRHQTAANNTSSRNRQKQLEIAL
jgi:DNA (cytosine-5)-methyltransferase 1